MKTLITRINRYSVRLIAILTLVLFSYQLSLQFFSAEEAQLEIVETDFDEENSDYKIDNLEFITLDLLRPDFKEQRSPRAISMEPMGSLGYFFELHSPPPELG